MPGANYYSHSTMRWSGPHTPVTGRGIQPQYGNKSRGAYLFRVKCQTSHTHPSLNSTLMFLKYPTLKIWVLFGEIKQCSNPGQGQLQLAHNWSHGPAEVTWSLGYERKHRLHDHCVHHRTLSSHSCHAWKYFSISTMTLSLKNYYFLVHTHHTRTFGSGLYW